MKRASSVFVLALLVFTSALASFSQTRRVERLPEFARFGPIQAFTDGEGAYIRWNMEKEAANIGFLVYRIDGGGMVPVSDVISGSIAKNGLRPLYGASYDHFDLNGAIGTSYVIVSLAADGRRLQSLSFTPQYTTDFLGDTGYTKEFLVERAQYLGSKLQIDSAGLTRQMMAEVIASRPAPNPEGQQRATTLPGVKIAVKAEGMYRVTRAELQNAGFDVDSDPTNWRLFMNGNEQAINVDADSQYIEFYGRGIDTFETDTRIYYLVNDVVPGRRMISKHMSSIGGNVVSHNYRFNSEFKERVSYNSNVHNGDTENYFGRPIISDPPMTETFTLSGIDPAGQDAYIQIGLQGIGFSNSQHNVHVIINGVDAGILSGVGVTRFGGTIVAPASLLQEGTNSITFNSGASNDTSYFDYVRVNYARKYVAEQSRAQFVTAGYRVSRVTGFTSPNIRVFDTSLDGDPQLIIDLPIVPDGNGFAVRMPSNRPAVFYAFEDAALLQSPSVTADAPSSLTSTTNDADMIIISYSAPDFMAAAQTWADYRHSRIGGSHRVMVVDIADVYDEFSYGTHTGQAIKDFLEYTYENWQTRPSFVLLMGDASFDRRNYEGFGNWDLIPSKNVSLIFEETGSDEALADFDHNGVADIAIGRIPVRNATTIQTVLNKTMIFELPANETLDRGSLFAYDVSGDYDFQGMSRQLENHLPANMPSLFVGKTDPNAQQALIEGMNTGPYLVNYSGHGSAGVWASTGFFAMNNVSQLTNASRPSIFNMLTCFNGLFLRPNADSLGESLLKAVNGGAAATWSSTTETTPDYQLRMGEAFYQGIADDNIPHLGDMVRTAKLTIAGSDVGYSWVLLGDPALRIR